MAANNRDDVNKGLSRLKISLSDTTMLESKLQDLITPAYKQSTSLIAKQFKLLTCL